MNLTDALYFRLSADPADGGVRLAGAGGGGGGGGDTVTAPDKVTVPEEETEGSLDQPWHVLVFNDPVNLMQYVTFVLQRVFGYSAKKAEQMMLDVHQKGKCIVWTGERERAEHYTQQLQAHQLLSSMQKAG
jgi:ATP-dependent Clp protease adaptor protein ClpS